MIFKPPLRGFSFICTLPQQQHQQQPKQHLQHADVSMFFHNQQHAKTRQKHDKNSHKLRNI